MGMRRLLLGLALLAVGFPAPARSQASGDFAGSVDIGGRKIHLECRGAGGPAVILVSGYRSDAEVWTIEPGPGLTPVFSAVARFTRVCAWDRPGTILDLTNHSRSDPIPMPRTAESVVSELHTLLGKAGIRPPYVLAAHSLGGLFARLYAATYPGEVAGLVLVDAYPESLSSHLGPEQWAAYEEVARTPPPGLDYPDLELVDFAAASRTMEQAAKASPLKSMPLVVIARGKPVILPSNVPARFSPEAFERAWQAGQRDLAGLLPGTRFVVAQESEHNVQVEQPALVVDAIRAVVDAVRDPARWPK